MENKTKKSPHRKSLLLIPDSIAANLKKNKKKSRQLKGIRIT